MTLGMVSSYRYMTTSRCYVSCFVLVEFMHVQGTKNVVKAVRKVGQGRVKDEGKTWFPQLRDKRKHLLIIQIVEIISLSCLQNAVVKYIFTTA